MCVSVCVGGVEGNLSVATDGFREEAACVCARKITSPYLRSNEGEEKGREGSYSINPYEACMKPVLLPEAFLLASSTLIDLTVMLPTLLLPLPSLRFLPLTGERDGAWRRGGHVGKAWRCV